MITRLNCHALEQDVETTPAGQYVFRAGDPGDAMYAVVEGHVSIVLHGHLIEEIGPGGIFGEMALVDAEPRTADAIADVDSKIAKINQDRFLFLAKYNPFFTLDVLRVTVERLRRRVAENVKAHASNTEA